MELNKALEKATKVCSGERVEYDTFSHIYPFTTERIAGYIDHFDLKDKSLLTVGSSSDQVINAILKGSRDITLLDVNPYIRYYYYLKVAGILSFTYEQFFKFFQYHDYSLQSKKLSLNEKVFNKKSYEKLKSVLMDLDYESYEFWNTLFEQFEPVVVRRSLFSNDENKTRIIIKSNPYLVPSSFTEIKDLISKVHITFVNQDAVKASLDRKFDNIWLSNIHRFIGDEAITRMFRNMAAMIEKNGQLLIAYVYGPSAANLNDQYSRINNIIRQFECNNIDLTPISFLGINGLESNTKLEDAALVYKRP